MSLVAFLVAVVISIIMWVIIIFAVIGLFKWNLVLGFFLVIALLAGAYHLVTPDET